MEKQEALDKQYEPTACWQAFNQNWELVAETSDPNDRKFKELLKDESLKVFRMYEKRMFAWVPERPEEK